MTELERLQKKIDSKNRRLLKIEESLKMFENQRVKILNDLKVLEKRRRSLKGEQIAELLKQEGIDDLNLMEILKIAKKNKGDEKSITQDAQNRELEFLDRMGNSGAGI